MLLVGTLIRIIISITTIFYLGCFIVFFPSLPLFTPLALSFSLLPSPVLSPSLHIPIFLFFYTSPHHPLSSSPSLLPYLPSVSQSHSFIFSFPSLILFFLSPFSHGHLYNTFILSLVFILKNLPFLILIYISVSFYPSSAQLLLSIHIYSPVVSHEHLYFFHSYL